MGFGDTFDPAGMLAYSNQIENMRMRNKLYEMQYSKQEQAQHEQALREKTALDFIRKGAAAQQATGLDYADPTRQGGGTPSGGMVPTASSSAIGDISIDPSARIASVHNNPGNLMYAGQPGATQGEPKKGGGYWAKFETPEAGWQATISQVALDQKRGLTIGQLINKYAPPSENNTLVYSGMVAKQLGVNPDTPASQLPADSIARSIVGIESGTKVNTGNMTADASGRTVPLPSGGQPQGASGMAPQGQQQFPNTLLPDSLKIQPTDDDATVRGKLDAQEYFTKQQAAVDQRNQQETSTYMPQIAKIVDQYDALSDNAGKNRFLDEQTKRFQNNPKMLQMFDIWRHANVTPSGVGNFDLEPMVPNDALINIARQMGAKDEVLQQMRLAQQSGTTISGKVRDGRMQGPPMFGDKPKMGKGSEEDKSKTKEQLAHEIARKKWQGAGNTGEPPPENIGEELKKLGADKAPNKLDIWLKAAEDEKKAPLTPEERKKVEMRFDMYEKTGVEDFKDMKPLMDAIADGTLSISDLSRRAAFYNPLINEIKRQYPNLNLAQAVEQHKFRSTQTYHAAEVSLSALPVGLEEVTRAGVGLKFPKFKKAAEADAWAKENMLNPIYRDYLVARADVILNVTRAIRGGVPSDISQKMEEGAFPVPLDPKSVYEWYKTQSKLMAPYMKGYGLVPPKLKSFEEMKTGTAEQPAESKSREDFIKKAKAAGSKMSDEDLGKYYDQEHGGE